MTRMSIVRSKDSVSSNLFKYKPKIEDQSETPKIGPPNLDLKLMSSHVSIDSESASESDESPK